MRTSQPLQRSNTRRSTQRAFSLIEMLVGLVVISLLLGLGIPSFRSWVINSQIRDGAEAILNGIQVARANAIQQNRLVVFDLTAQNGATPASWWVRLDSNVNSGPDIQAWTGAEGAKNTTVTAAGGTRVSFNGLGQRVSNSDGSPMLTQVDVASSTSSSAEVRALRIVVSASGSPKMCDPDPVLVSAGDPRAC
jgi:type IV fimbrial biogenesis protein FimT